eukprot:93608-Chlamydomonas_euryale.AAC.6
MLHHECGTACVCIVPAPASTDVVQQPCCNMFTQYYNKGFIIGIGVGLGISVWWANRCGQDAKFAFMRRQSPPCCPMCNLIRCYCTAFQAKHLRARQG